MGTESPENRYDALLSEIKVRLEDIEAELNEEIEQGRVTLVDRLGEIRDRLDQLEADDVDFETVGRAQLGQLFEELAADIEEEVEKRKEDVTTIVDEIRHELRELEQKV